MVSRYSIGMDFRPSHWIPGSVFESGTAGQNVELLTDRPYCKMVFNKSTLCDRPKFLFDAVYAANILTELPITKYLH